MADLKSSSQLIRQLRSILFKQRFVLFAAGVLLTVAVVATAVIALSLLANVMVLPVWFKVSLLVVTGAASLYFFGRYALARLFTGDVDEVALKLERSHEDLKGRLIAAVQFARMKPHPSYSLQLLAQTEKQALERARGINFNEAVSFHAVLKSGKIFIVGAALAVLLISFFPGLFSYSYEVYSNITTEVAPPIAYEVIPVPESTEWVKYRDIRIGAAIVGQRFPEKAYVHHRLAGGNWQKTEVDLRALPKAALAQGDSAQFGITLRQINRSFDFYVTAGRVETPIQSVDVVDRPRVTGIKLSIFYPDYTTLAPMVMDENNGSFSAVVGSRANIAIETNLPVERAQMVFEDSSRLAMSVDGKTASAPLLVDNSRSYHIELVDHLGEKNPDPIEYYITAVPDEYPSVEVVRPGFDVNLSDEMILPLMARIYDDFGFSSLVLKYTVVTQGQASEENVAVLHFSEKIETEGEIEFNWDLEPLNLFPGDYVIYHFEVADNDVISGPKVSESRKYVARLPSLEEVIAQTETQGQERIVRTEELIKSGRDLAQRLKKVARKLEAEIQSSNKTDWEHKKELESIAQKNAELLDQVEQGAQQMEKSLKEMQKNSLLSRQVIEKLAEIQKLFEEVATPEMREAQEKLMEALKNMNREQLDKAMKDFELSQEELLERLERTLALLKRMQLEQKMDAMIRQAEELVKRQEAMNEKTEGAHTEELPSMSEDEQKLESALQDLKAEVENFRELMEQAKMAESQEAQKFADAVEQTDADRDMQEMSQSMSGQQKSEAMKSGKQAHSKLTQMLGEMQKQQLALQSQSSDQIRQALRRAIDDANYLSKGEEELAKEAAAIDPRSIVLRDVARSQQDLKSSCAGLQATIGELGRQSPFIAGELQGLLNEALAHMDLSVEQLENKNGAAAMQSQRDAMSLLNKTSIRLMESLDQQNQCDKASNCNSGIAKLESLCNKQNRLNQQTQGMCNNPGAGGGQKAGPQYRQGLERLAGEQGAIRKSVEQLAQEFGNSRQILGRLDDIAGEMKDVEEALASGEVGEQVAERQLRILSRMLEASRSLQRRDFSEERKAATATGQPVYIPPSLSDDILNDRVQLEDRLRKFLGTGYPAQYEEQIKAYFRALLKVQSAGGTAPDEGGSVR
jgi:hypothetical protein